jgi:hypothetical protein
MKGRGDLFSEGRKSLPHSIERQLGLKIHPRTAHKRPAAATVTLTCLYITPEYEPGGVRQLRTESRLRPSEKRSPRPFPTRSILMVFQRAKVLQNFKELQITKRFIVKKFNVKMTGNDKNHKNSSHTVNRKGPSEIQFS